jgi:DNA replication and repair protein RecF
LRLKSLSVDGFRNLEVRDLALGSSVTQIYGANAQGKTNLLEAIYLLGTTRSFREHRAEYLVREGREGALVRGVVERYGVRHDLGVELGRSGRGYTKDGASVPLSGYLGAFPTVVLSSEDGALIAGEPRHRRQFLDAAGVWRRPAYLETLMAFGRCRQQRTQVLREYTGHRRKELAAWDQAFVKLGREIQGEREAVARVVGESVAREAEALGFKEEVELVYGRSGDGDLESALERVRQEEIRRGLCLVGPQRDDVEFLMNGQRIQAFGSSGQQRTALWILKLAMVQLIARETGEPPILLLDDAEAELDEQRFRRLMTGTGGKAQVVMTASRRLPAGGTDEARYRMEAGRVSREA